MDIFGNNIYKKQVRFMSPQITDDAVEELKAENLQLKLEALRKSQDAIKIDVHRHLDLVIETSNEKFARILEQTTKTNGSVARAIDRISALEREDNKQRVSEAKKEIDVLKKELKFFRTIVNNKWIVGLMGLSMYALSISEVRGLLINLIK